MELGYPNGVATPNLPLEGQIIRVADEFDAITSKRQYKSHVGVCDTLKILIDKTHPDKNINPKVGKVNPKVVKALIKVVIDDTEYEIYNLEMYLDYIKKEINRLEQITNYKNKMDAAKSESDKAYYANGIKMLLDNGETMQNYQQVLQEYNQAYVVRQQGMDKLVQELKDIKKLKV